MKELQQLINKWKEQLFILENAEKNHKRQNRYSQAFECRVAWEQLRQCTTAIELLLKHGESKQPQPPDFANTMLGEVPHEVNDQQEEISKAVEGAIPVVRQNEQTKEVRTYIEGDDIWTEW